MLGSRVLGHFGRRHKKPTEPDFTSAAQTITGGGALTIAHGLGITPYNIQIWVKNTSAELNYSVDDEFQQYAGDLSGNNRGVSIVPDATNLNVRYGSAANVFSGLNKTTGASAVLVDSKWKLILRVWL
tara:strand:+ start:66 stop:449 length:384 start_codon:yes stop_codon:yes gene_type:complete